MVSESVQKFRDMKMASAKIGFFVHLLFYVLGNAILIGINLATLQSGDKRILWFIFPLAGWGLGVVLHYVFAIPLHPERVREWKHKEIERLLQG